MRKTVKAGRWAILALLAGALSGCGADGGGGGARAAEASPPAKNGMPADPCALITAADVTRISGYSGAVRRETSSESVCWWTVDGQRFGVSISLGRYVATPFLGGSDVDLGGGIRGRRSDAGWLDQILLPDQTSLTLLLDGTAIASGPAKGDYLLTLGDGREVDLREQYEAYARQIVARLR